MATGPFGKYAGLHLGAGKKIRMDKTMTDGTLILNDLKDAKGAPQVSIGAAVPAGTALKSFVSGTPASQVAGSNAVRNASGLQMDGSGYVNLGNAARLAPGLYDWVFIIWLKATDFGSNSSNNRLLYLTNNDGNSPSTAASLTITKSAGVVTTAQFSYSGHADTVLNSTMRAALTDGALHQFAFAMESSEDGTLQRARHYLDGVLQRTLPYYTKRELVANTGTDVAQVGRSGYSTLIGTISRIRLENTALAGMSPGEIVSSDFGWRDRLAA